MRIPRPFAVALMIVIPAVLRMLQIEWNVVPIGALALFCGAHFRNRWLAASIPISAMVLGDILLGLKHHDVAFYTFHSLVPFVYGCYLLSVTMGIGLQHYWDHVETARRTERPTAESRPQGVLHSAVATRVVPIAATTLAGSFLFYLVTNFGDWYLFNTYPKSWSGLIECYVAAIPYFRGTLMGDVVGSVLLFGGESMLRLGPASVPESERI